jgi:hypothetical protein
LPGVFWLTRSPKKSFAVGWLARVSHDGAAWKAALAAAAESWVALTTGSSPARELKEMVSKDRATGRCFIKHKYFNGL